MVWTIVALNLALSVFCLWIAGHLLKLHHNLRRTNRSLQVALNTVQHALSPAPLWLAEKQVSLLQLRYLIARYGTRWQQLQKIYLLFLFAQQVWPKRQFILSHRRLSPKYRY
jgi:hypothetical protein